MGNKPELGAGDVPFELDGQQHFMRSSYEACQAICKLGHGGGPVAVINRLRGLDFDTMLEVIAIGTGYTSLNERKMIGQALYKQGLISVAADCILFVRAVINGGVIPKDEDEERGAGGEADDPLPTSPSESSTTS